jgi:hypothetical protein
VGVHRAPPTTSLGPDLALASNMRSSLASGGLHHLLVRVDDTVTTLVDQVSRDGEGLTALMRRFEDALDPDGADVTVVAVDEQGSARIVQRERRFFSWAAIGPEPHPPGHGRPPPRPRLHRE